MVARITPQTLSAWFAQAPGRSPLVLDVREPWELARASVSAQGFEVLAIPMGQIPERLADIDTERPIACLCHHGIRSLQVALWLAHQGYAHVANITGGIDAWAQEHDPHVPRY